MDAVLAIAARSAVVGNGAWLASDTPSAVRGDELVQAAYLGGHA